jgi:hypothetical protein
MQAFGVGKAAAHEPELLVVADRVHDKRIFFPAADGGAVVTRDDVGGLALWAAVRIDDAPVAIAVAEEHEDAAELALLDKLKPLRPKKLPRSTRRHAAGDRIVLELRSHAIVEHGLRPGHRDGVPAFRFAVSGSCTSAFQ